MVTMAMSTMMSCTSRLKATMRCRVRVRTGRRARVQSLRPVWRLLVISWLRAWVMVVLEESSSALLPLSRHHLLSRPLCRQSLSRWPLALLHLTLWHPSPFCPYRSCPFLSYPPPLSQFLQLLSPPLHTPPLPTSRLRPSHHAPYTDSHLPAFLPASSTPSSCNPQHMHPELDTEQGTTAHILTLLLIRYLRTRAPGSIIGTGTIITTTTLRLQAVRFRARHQCRSRIRSRMRGEAGWLGGACRGDIRGVVGKVNH
jgi:hypothetical protein